MSYVRARFRDPAAILADYTWQVMWSEEEGRDFRRNLERTAVTSGVGFVRQQGEDSPQTFKLSGTILHKNQYDRMKAYYEACRTRTILFRDFEDTEYEVIFTSFNPQRKRTLRNPKDAANIPLHYWSYQAELEVIG